MYSLQLHKQYFYPYWGHCAIPSAGFVEAISVLIHRSMLILGVPRNILSAFFAPLFEKNNTSLFITTLTRCFCLHFKKYMWSRQRICIYGRSPRNWQLLSPPLSTAVEGGAPSGMMCSTYTLSMQLDTFPHKFPQNGSFFLLFFFNPTNFNL